MAIAIYEDITSGRRHWAESTSPKTQVLVANGRWVLFDDTPSTPPPSLDPLGAEMAERVPGSGPFAVALRAASVAAVEDADEVTPTGAWDFTGATVTGVGAEGGAATPFDVREGGLLHAILASREQAPVRVAFLGSSTLEDWQNDPPQRAVNRIVSMMQAAYPSGQPTEAPVLTIATGAASLNVTPGIQGYNGAKGGTTVTDYLASGRREEVIALQPRVIFHMVGANNYSAGTNPATYQAALQSTIADLDANITGPLVHVLLHSFAMPLITSPAYPWSAYGDAMRAVAASNPDRTYVIDLSEPFAKANIATTDPLDLIGTDLAHPTDAGQALIAELVGRGLNLPTPTRSASSGGGFPPPIPAAGNWFHTAAPLNPTTLAPGNGSLRVLPWLVQKQQTIDRIAAEVTAVGEASSVLRVVIYADNGNCAPGALIRDVGEQVNGLINGASATVQEKTLTTPLTLAPGLYWIGAVVQNATTTPPTMRVNTLGWTPPVLPSLGTALPGAGSSMAGIAVSGVTGPAPATFPAGGFATGQAPRILARAA